MGNSGLMSANDKAKLDLLSVNEITINNLLKDTEYLIYLTDFDSGLYTFSCDITGYYMNKGISAHVVLVTQDYYPTAIMYLTTCVINTELNNLFYITTYVNDNNRSYAICIECKHDLDFLLINSYHKLLSFKTIDSEIQKILNNNREWYGINLKHGYNIWLGNINETNLYTFTGGRINVPGLVCNNYYVTNRGVDLSMYAFTCDGEIERVLFSYTISGVTAWNYDIYDDIMAGKQVTVVDKNTYNIFASDRYKQINLNFYDNRASSQSYSLELTRIHTDATNCEFMYYNEISENFYKLYVLLSPSGYGGDNKTMKITSTLYSHYNDGCTPASTYNIKDNTLINDAFYNHLTGVSVDASYTIIDRKLSQIFTNNNIKYIDIKFYDNIEDGYSTPISLIRIKYWPGTINSYSNFMYYNYESNAMMLIELTIRMSSGMLIFDPPKKMNS